MTMDESTRLKPLHWIGSSRRDLKALPKPVVSRSRSSLPGSYCHEETASCARHSCRGGFGQCLCRPRLCRQREHAGEGRTGRQDCRDHPAESAYANGCGKDSGVNAAQGFCAIERTISRDFGAPLIRMLNPPGPGCSHYNQTGATQPNEWAIDPFCRIKFTPRESRGRRPVCQIAHKKLCQIIQENDSRGELSTSRHDFSRWSIRCPTTAASSSSCETMARSRTCRSCDG